MNWTKTLKGAARLTLVATGLMTAPIASAQSGQASADTAKTSTTNVVTLNLSMDELTRIVQSAADAIRRNSEDVRNTITAATDSTAKTGAAALKEILSVSTTAAMQLLTELNEVVDSVATANKATVEAARAVAEAKAAQAGKMISEGAQTLTDMARTMTQAQTDSLSQALRDTRDAIDAAIEQLDKSKQRQEPQQGL